MQKSHPIHPRQAQELRDAQLMIQTAIRVLLDGVPDEGDRKFVAIRGNEIVYEVDEAAGE